MSGESRRGRGSIFWLYRQRLVEPRDGGVTVLLRDAHAPNSDAQPEIDWAGGEIVAVVVLLDRAAAIGSRWALYLQGIVGKQTSAAPPLACSRLRSKPAC